MQNISLVFKNTIDHYFKNTMNNFQQRPLIVPYLPSYDYLEKEISSLYLALKRITHKKNRKPPGKKYHEPSIKKSDSFPCRNETDLLCLCIYMSYHFGATMISQLFFALFHASNIQVCLNKLSHFLSKPVNV